VVEETDHDTERGPAGLVCERGVSVAAEVVYRLRRHLHRNKVLFLFGTIRRDTGGETRVLDLSPVRVRALSRGYPYGARFNFGISLAGAVVTVHPSICWRKGRAVAIAETPITLTTDGDWIALRVELTGALTETAVVVRWAAGSVPADNDGKVFRALHRCGFANGQASLAFSAMFGGDVGMMGH
jgi:hypothetical protein